MEPKICKCDPVLWVLGQQLLEHVPAVRRQLAEFNLPADSRVRFVPWVAFKECSALTRVVIPGVSHFSDEVFHGCTKLRSARFALPGQTKEQRNRNIRIARDLFRGLRVFVTYPQATLKAAREVLKEYQGDFE
jgi:hypothetical protein